MKIKIALLVATLLTFSINIFPREVESKYDKRYHQADTLDQSLPRVLLVGNSICSGYYRKVRVLLKGKANVDAWTTGSNIRKPTIAEDQRKILSYGPYEVIHFNTGLHGLGDRIPSEEYEPLLREYVNVYQSLSPKSKLIWQILKVMIRLKGNRPSPLVQLLRLLKLALTPNWLPNGLAISFWIIT
jgi:hypothetical protein